ncbi:hypothetical protein Pmani_008524 [Petrolisthes manimaculis]|uniref:Uncharacterized protein n=1 Tax=Petrolisthes manimaculis TaxID=1843537 RepID=A0AAE1Q6N4_9EUCA|nr:hypothetical protein Pmani_008524 [Petrolisthes manimaculis]
MPSAVAFRDTTSGAGGNASRTFPSLMPSKFCQRSDVGFMQLVEEASRPTRNSHISIANMEPFLLKNAVSNSNSLHQVSNQDSDKDFKDNNSNSFDWSRNINRLRDEQRASSRERRGDKSHSNSVTPELRRMGSRWRGDGIMTSTRMDAITGRDPLSELVVELNSRECSPHAKPKTASRWPSVVSVHGRPISSSRRNRRGSIGKDKSNHGLSLLPQILKNSDKKGRRVPPLPTNSEETFDEWVTEQERKIMNNPRTPMKSRRPQQPGQPRSPLLSRSPRHSVSRPGEDILAGQRTARNTPSPDFDFDDSENTETEPSSPSDRSSINTNSEAGTPSSGKKNCAFDLYHTIFIDYFG